VNSACSANIEAATFGFSRRLSICSRNATSITATILFASIYSSLITSGHVLDNMSLFQLEFTEKIAGVLLPLSKDMLYMLELSKNSLKTLLCTHIT
jgi:hypothetical protein